jgi:hypothetical protein
LRRGESATWGPRPEPGPIASPKRLQLLEWRPLIKGALCGFASIELPIGLTIPDCPVFVSGEREWVNLPARPQLDRDNQARLDPSTGKVLYAALLEWRDRELRDRFSAAVIAALREAGHRLGDAS